MRNDIVAHAGHEILHNGRHGLESVFQSSKEAKHALQIFRLVVGQQNVTSGTFLFEQDHFHLFEQFFFHHFEQFRFGGWIEIVGNSRLFFFQTRFRLEQIIRSAIDVDPFPLFARKVLSRTFQQRFFQIGIVTIQRSHAHTFVELDDILDERLVNDFARALLLNQLQNGGRRIALDGIVNVRSKIPQSRLAQRGKRMVLDVIPIEIGEEFFEPLVHDLVIFPTQLEFLQQNGSTLARLLLEGRKNGMAEVLFDRFAVTLIEFPTPIVRRTLCAHVITCPVIINIIIISEIQRASLVL